MARLEDYITSRFPKTFDSVTKTEIATAALNEFMAPLYARPLLPDSPNPEDLLTLVTNCALDRLQGAPPSDRGSSADEAPDGDERLISTLFGEHLGHKQVRATLANARKENQTAEVLVVTEYITLFERHRRRPKLEEVAKELRPLEKYLHRTVDEAFVQTMLFKFVNRLPAEGG
jgi:hypothetical protein